MGIERFYTTTFTYKRMVWVNESSSEVVQGTFKGHIQQANAELVQSLGLCFTTAYTIWCSPDVVIQEQDKITDGTYTYSVRGINNRDYNIGSMNPHLQLVVERKELKK